jgi:Rhs element Vgr protein
MMSRSLYTWSYSTAAAGQGADAFRVLAFTGEDTICQGYTFDILLVANNVTDSTAPAFLQAMAEAQNHKLMGSAHDPAGSGDGSDLSFSWSGMPERVDWLFPATDGGTVLRVLLRPHSYKLRLGVHSRIFLNVALDTLLDNLLQQEGFTSTDDFTTSELKQNYKTRPLSCQYNESSFDFLLRHLERVGAYSYIEELAAGDRLVLADAEGEHSPPSLPSNIPLELDPSKPPGKSLIFSFAKTMGTSAGSVTLRDYSTEKPGSEGQTVTPATMTIDGKAYAPLRGGGTVNWHGRFNMFGETGLDTYSAEDAQFQAQLMAQARVRSLVCRNNRFQGQSTVAWMRGGYSFLLSGKRYQLLTVCHTCNNCQSDDDNLDVGRAGGLGFSFDVTRQGYTNSFDCHNLELGNFAPEISIARPAVSGLTHAVVYASASSGGYAEIDDKGRYTVRLPFPEGVYDASNQAVTTGAVPIPLRMAQINAGTKGTVHSGAHFPLLDGTEVLVAFTDGDPDRPVIMAALPNATNTSVVTDANNKTNVIETPGGHRLTLDDTTAAPKIIVASNAGHTLTLDDTTAAPRIIVTSSAGHTLTLDDTTATPKITLTSKNGHTLTLDDTSASKITLTSRGGHAFTLDDTATAPRITLTSTAGNTLTMNDTTSATAIEIKSTGGHSLKMNDASSAPTIALASSNGIMSLVMDQAEEALTIKYGENSTKLTGAKAYELVTTHKESTVGGNVYSSTLGASEIFTVGEKLTMAAALSQTVNIVSNMTINMGLNNTLNLGSNSTSNIGPTTNFKSSAATDITVGDETWIGMSASRIAAQMLSI